MLTEIDHASNLLRRYYFEELERRGDEHDDCSREHPMEAMVAISSTSSGEPLKGHEFLSWLAGGFDPNSDLSENFNSFQMRGALEGKYFPAAVCLF